MIFSLPQLFLGDDFYSVGWKENGIASWYGGKFQGRLTANGEIFDTNHLTAAHKELPFNSIVRVTSHDTKLSVDVRINDRGPFVEGRTIDLSLAAAQAIKIASMGTSQVTVQVIKRGDGKTYHHLKLKPKTATPIQGGNWIQIGAFSSKENANKLLLKLKGEGISAQQLLEGNLYKVGVSFKTETEMKELLKKIEFEGYGTPVVRTIKVRVGK